MKFELENCISNLLYIGISGISFEKIINLEKVQQDMKSEAYVEIKQRMALIFLKIYLKMCLRNYSLEYNAALVPKII